MYLVTSHHCTLGAASSLTTVELESCKWMIFQPASLLYSLRNLPQVDFTLWYLTALSTERSVCVCVWPWTVKFNFCLNQVWVVEWHISHSFHLFTLGGSGSWDGSLFSICTGGLFECGSCLGFPVFSPDWICLAPCCCGLTAQNTQTEVTRVLWKKIESRLKRTLWVVVWSCDR